MKLEERRRVSAAADRLVESVSEQIARSPGNRAALRRSVGRAPEHPQSRHAIALVARHIPPESDEAVERAFYAVAALIAAQPRQSPQDDSDDDVPNGETADELDAATGVKAPESWNLGATLGRAVALPGSPLKFDTVEARLHLLCRQRIDGLHRQLPRLVSQLKAIRVPVDWSRLTVDLSRWGTDADYVAKEWLQDYYRTYFRLKPTDETPPPIDESEGR
ncbi:CRISPR system Cascade subunit CasB [Actinomadura pelletieri DSM 43383]|uniref:CRISPR system Cascade subunit CasB n=1 Tax=Actinomadura pelletieri DSM 43383 TaxID=1120940 RepID=A0A495Q9H6_9ACTN|nr:type I-E CRISPR-associated protein Cse2/CasB [Actinomadura pelletieri]RKS68102.1 CRISPR system Cascade subunit CasB [Actinomadura pelletieri DSM 43383]